MVLRILGIALVVFIAISLIGAVFKFLAGALVIGALIFVGAGIYSAVRSGRNRRELR
jgi:hypothetical protein